MRLIHSEFTQKCIISVLLLAAFCILTGKTFQYQYSPVSMVEENGHKSVSSARTTSSYRYSTQFNKTLNNNNYNMFRSLYQSDLSCAIPGLASTDVLGINCEHMVPQGLCIAGNYMLISAYDNGYNMNNKNGYVPHNSVIYVLSNTDPSNRTYLTTIVLPDVNHVGGLAFDGRNVWVAKSTEETCSAIDISIIEQAVNSGQNSFELTSYTADVFCGMTASFITFFDQKLWVGTFVTPNRANGTLSAFEITGEGQNLTLSRVNSLKIPCNANGVNITEVNGKVCMAVVSSFSRLMDTKVYLYELSNVDSADITASCYGTYRFPPMGEEVVSDGRNAYFLFESAASCYSSSVARKCANPVDRVCAVSLDDLFFWTAEECEWREVPELEMAAMDRAVVEAVLPLDTMSLLERITRNLANESAWEKEMAHKGTTRGQIVRIAHELAVSRGPTGKMGRYTTGFIEKAAA